jgi:hypothetical protein
MDIGVEEATMAALTLRNTSRTLRLRQRFAAALFACREWLDAFVSDRMRHAVAEVENIGRADAVRDDKPDL